MRRLLLLLTILALVAAPEAFGAQDIRINPVPPGVKPQWTRVPGTPQVSWAPNLPTDVFRYGGKYYFFWENYFYRGPAPEGPWKAVVKVPKVFYQVDPAYFKTVKPAGGPGNPRRVDAVPQGENHRDPAHRTAGPGPPGACAPGPDPARRKPRPSRPR